MKLPGVKRIEALIGVLKEKEREAIAIASEGLPSDSEIRAMVDEEFGLTGVKAEIEEIRIRLRDISDVSSALYGSYYELSTQPQYSSNARRRYDHRLKELTQELRGQYLDKIREEYKRKESALWLVESIEEAKAIVGIE